jgi:hypothetical protein
MGQCFEIDPIVREYRHLLVSGESQLLEVATAKPLCVSRGERLKASCSDKSGNEDADVFVEVEADE